MVSAIAPVRLAIVGTFYVTTVCKHSAHSDVTANVNTLGNSLL